MFTTCFFHSSLTSSYNGVASVWSVSKTWNVSFFTNSWWTTFSMVEICLFTYLFTCLLILSQTPFPVTHFHHWNLICFQEEFVNTNLHRCTRYLEESKAPFEDKTSAVYKAGHQCWAGLVSLPRSESIAGQAWQRSAFWLTWQNAKLSNDQRWDRRSGPCPHF